MHMHVRELGCDTRPPHCHCRTCSSFIHIIRHPPNLHIFLQIDYALGGSASALGYDQIQLLDTSNPPATGLDASAWEMTTQTLMNDWNEELPPQFRQGL